MIMIEGNACPGGQFIYLSSNFSVHGGELGRPVFFKCSTETMVKEV